MSDDAPTTARRIRLDLSPLRSSRDFRRLFAAGVVTYLGSMFTFVAIPLQAQQLTGSFLVVGALGLVEVVPLVVFGLWGGALADHVDRRVMILSTEAASGLCALLLLANALLPEPQVWVLFVVAAVISGLIAKQMVRSLPSSLQSLLIFSSEGEPGGGRHTGGADRAHR